MAGRRRSTAMAVAGAVWLLLMTTSGSSAQTLPSQVPPTAVEHTHGPDGLDLDPRGRRPPAQTYAVDAATPWSATDYDGVAPTTDQPDGDRSGLPMFHAIYLYPADKASYPVTRFTTYAAMFQADARDASKLLETLYGRALRFDQRLSTSGKPVLDITVVKSQFKAAQLAGANQFDLVSKDLAGKVVAPNKKYVVWLDAGSQYCGQGNLAQDVTRSAANASEGRTLAIVYRPYSMTDASSGGFCRGRTLRHEMGHTMGALQQVAPHAFDGAHCNDSGEDTMCYTFADSVDTGGPDFDYHNDDYWDPVANPTYPLPYPSTAPNGKLPWWTVNLSTYLCNTPSTCAQPASPPGY